jgi:hypothetical protein
MPRIKIEDLPVLEELSADQAKGIFGGFDVPLVGKEEEKFDVPLVGKEDDKESVDDTGVIR